MFKRMMNWFIYTVIAGILPIGIALIICNLVNVKLSYTMFFSGMFFVDLTLLADAMKVLYDIEKYKKFKITLYSVSLVLIIIVSVVYGIVLLNDYKKLELNMNAVRLMLYVFTGACIVIDVCTEIIGGVESESQ